jgi:ribulose-phosphate 3-epimerase
MIDKVRRLRGMLDERGLSPDIALDGGVKVNNISQCIAAGANVLVCGSSVYNSDASPQTNLRALRDAAVAATSK